MKFNKHIQEAFNDELAKLAKLGPGDVYPNTDLNRKEFKSIKDKLDVAYAKPGVRGTILRNPWLTGIPTLGIAPAVAKSGTIADIRGEVARSRTQEFVPLNKHLATMRANTQLQETLVNTQLKNQALENEQTDRMLYYLDRMSHR